MSFVPNNQFIATLARFASKFSALDNKIKYSKQWLKTSNASSVSFCPVPCVPLDPFLTFSFSANGKDDITINLSTDDNVSSNSLKVHFPFSVYGGTADIANGILHLTHFGKVAIADSFTDDTSTYYFNIPLIKAIADDAESTDVLCNNTTDITVNFTAGANALTLAIAKADLTVEGSDSPLDVFNAYVNNSSPKLQIAYKLNAPIDICMNRYKLIPFAPTNKYSDNSHTATVSGCKIQIGYLPYCIEE